MIATSLETANLKNQHNKKCNNNNSSRNSSSRSSNNKNNNNRSTSSDTNSKCATSKISYKNRKLIVLQTAGFDCYDVLVFDDFLKFYSPAWPPSRCLPSTPLERP